jgi:WD40 repeat protein
MGTRIESFPKSDLVAVRTDNGTSRDFSVWDPRTLQRNQVLEFGRSADFLAISWDGALIAVTSFDPVGMAMVSSWPELRMRGEFRQHLLGAHGVCFSPDNQRLATGSTGRESVRIWDMATQMELLTLETEHSQFERMEFSPDGNRLAAKTYFNELHVWTAPTWEQIEAETAEEAARLKAPETSLDPHRNGK